MKLLQPIQSAYCTPTPRVSYFYSRICSETSEFFKGINLIYIKVPKKGSSAPLPIVVRRLMCLSSIACNTDYSHPVFSFGPLLSQCCSVSQINGSGQASPKWQFRRDSPSCSESAEICHVDSFCVKKCPSVDKIQTSPLPLLSLSLLANFSGFWATRTLSLGAGFFGPLQIFCVCVHKWYYIGCLPLLLRWRHPSICAGGKFRDISIGTISTAPKVFGSIWKNVIVELGC